MITLFCCQCGTGERLRLKNALVSKNDQSWRLSTVSGSVAGHPEFNLTAKLCHQLPQMPQGEVA